MNQKQKNKSSFGSDHYIHLSIIEKIKSSSFFDYGVKRISGYNEKNAAYPILFHWIIARLFYKSAIYRPQMVNYFIIALSYLFFNLFIYLYLDKTAVTIINIGIYIKMNLIFSLFPFSYIYWNAKNMGLSARGFGLLIGQLFTYTIVFYLRGDSVNWFSMMTFASFLVLLGSQFAFQYVFFITLLISIITWDFQLMLPILISLIVFRIFFPKFSKEFFRGQCNHKINYALYLAPLNILKNRPSIYRDFIYDFWLKLYRFKSNNIRTIYYIYSNPLLELIYGFPFLWLILFYKFKKGSWILLKPEIFLNIPYSEITINSLDTVILGSLVIFFLTSLRPFRFLGEPQRYVEFVIPLISISFIYNVPENVHITVIFASLVFIITSKFIFNYFKEYANHNHQDITVYLQNKFHKNTFISSNDSNFSKFLIPYFNVLKTDLTRPYKNKNAFNFYHDNDFAIHSVNALLEFHKIYKTDLIIIKPQLYSQKEIDKLHSKLKLNEINTINNYIIYKT